MVRESASLRVITARFPEPWSSPESLAHYAVTHTGQVNFALDTAFVLIDAIAQATSTGERAINPKGDA
jgi:hypothetical protein